jgi:Malate/lactate dehydrogenases
MSKVTVIGAGNVGATCVNVLAHMNIVSEIVIIDIKEGLSEGKALDMMQTARLCGFNTSITGVTNQYEATANSDVIVVTSGIPRKPGMTREELIGTNAGIVKQVITSALQYSPNAIVIIISNPMDTMTYLALKSLNLPKERVIGMGGILDSSRFTHYLSQQTKAAPADIDAMVIGGHGDTTMIPLLRLAQVKGENAAAKMSESDGEKAVADTMVGGATLTKLIGTSAWYAPGAAAAVLVRAILNDEKKVFPCCAYLEGEYSQNDICIGVPVQIGKTGIEKILTLDLNAREKEAFEKSATAVRNMNNVLAELNLI